MTSLSSEEEAELARRIKAGDWVARAKLIEANLRFVISVAREYQNQGVPLADLISAGNMSLITAAERFDGTKGFKFISYAVWWIRQAILQALSDHSRVVRLPINQIDTLRRISRCASVLAQSKNRQPSAQEIAEELDISVDIVLYTLAAGQRIMSLDAVFIDNDENSLMEILADSRQEPPDAILERAALGDEIDKALATLSPREAEVLQLYFGLGGKVEMTLEAIGEKLGKTRERVRQIKLAALRKLHHPTRGKKLQRYAEEDGLIDPPAVYNQSIASTKTGQKPPKVLISWGLF